MKTNIPKISFIFLLLVVASLPTFNSLTPILIALFAVSTIFDAIINKTFSITNKGIFVTGIAFFLIHLISVIYSQNKSVAWFDIEVKLSLLVFPLLFIVKNKIITKNNEAILFTFAGAVLIANIYMATTTLFEYGIFEKDLIYSSYMSKYIHPSYMSMYNLFSITIILQEIITKKHKLRLLLIIPLLVLIGMIFMFGAKAGFFALIIVILYYSTLAFTKIQNRIIKYSLPLLILLITVTIISKSSRIEKMANSITEIITTGHSETKSTGVRFEIWKVTTEIIGDNILFGVGAGDIKKELNTKFKEKQGILGDASNKQLNVHNQYLETWLGQGIIGLVLLLGLLILGLKYARKVKNHLFAFFIIIIIVNFFPESMLNNMHGVVFFSLFFYLLSFKGKKKAFPDI